MHKLSVPWITAQHSKVTTHFYMCGYCHILSRKALKFTLLHNWTKELVRKQYAKLDFHVFHIPQNPRPGTASSFLLVWAQSTVVGNTRGETALPTRSILKRVRDRWMTEAQKGLPKHENDIPIHHTRYNKINSLKWPKETTCSQYGSKDERCHPGTCDGFGDVWLSSCIPNRNDHDIVVIQAHIPSFWPFWESSRSNQQLCYNSAQHEVPPLPEKKY